MGFVNQVQPEAEGQGSSVETGRYVSLGPGSGSEVVGSAPKSTTEALIVTGQGIAFLFVSLLSCVVQASVDSLIFQN